MRLNALIAMLLCTALAAPMLFAAEDPAVAQFKNAMAGQDSVAKASAMLAVAAMADKDQAIALLISAVDDRQGSQVAIAALRSISGLQPTNHGRRGNPGYPGYPTSDNAAGWSQWATARSNEISNKKQLDAVIKKLDDSSKKQEGPRAVIGAATTFESTDFGIDEFFRPSEHPQLSRIIFTNGSTLLCYIITKRVDLEGQLTSLKIQHRDGGGEEVLNSEIIARIEDVAR